MILISPKHFQNFQKAFALPLVPKASRGVTGVPLEVWARRGDSESATDERQTVLDDKDDKLSCFPRASHLWRRIQDSVTLSLSSGMEEGTCRNQ